MFFDDEKTSETYAEATHCREVEVAGAEGTLGDDSFLTSLG